MYFARSALWKHQLAQHLQARISGPTAAWFAWRCGKSSLHVTTQEAPADGLLLWKSAETLKAQKGGLFPPLHQWPKLTKGAVHPTRCSPGPLFIPTPFHLKPPGLSPSSSTWNQPSRTLFSILFTRYRAFTRPFIFTLTFICALPPQAANSVFRPSTNPFPRAQSAFITTPFDTQIYEKSWAF